MVQVTPQITPSVTPTPTRVSSDPGGSQEKDADVVTVWHGLEDQDALALFEVVSAFHKSGSDIRVALMYVPFDDLLEQYQTAVKAGNGPGVLLAPAEWGRPFYEGRLVSNIRWNISQQILTNLNPPAVEIATVDDAIVGLPYQISGVVMYRNAAIIGEPPKRWLN